MTPIPQQQLTLDVRPHPALRDIDQPILESTLKLSGTLNVFENLHTGEDLIVTVASADGRVLAQHYAEVGTPTFPLIRVKGVGIVGMARAHSAQVGDMVTSAGA